MANAIWVVTEIPRQSLVSLCINCLADLANRGHQGSLWWTRIDFRFTPPQVPRTAYPIPTVLATDLPGNWKYSRCLVYVYFASLSPCNPEGWLLTQIQGARRRSGFSVSGHIPTQQLGPTLSYTMFNLRLSRGRHGRWR